MSGAIVCLHSKRRRAAGGFISVSSIKQDQDYSRALRPATASLGGQEIRRDPQAYDPQLSARGAEGRTHSQEEKRNAHIFKLLGPEAAGKLGKAAIECKEKKGHEGSTWHTEIKMLL